MTTRPPSVQLAIMIDEDSPQPSCVMSGGVIPAIRFDGPFGNTSVLITHDDAPTYLREFAASLLHLAGLAEDVDLDAAMARVCASERAS
jgi:hypothetical protein